LKSRGRTSWRTSGPRYSDWRSGLATPGHERPPLPQPVRPTSAT
jgi:hypothetical protein